MSRDVVANFGGYIVSIFVTLLLTPVILRSLGDTRYGIWSLVAQLTGYYGLLDMGIRGAVSHFIARYSARDNTDQIKKTLCSAFWLLTGVGLVAVGIGIGLTAALPYIFTINDSYLVEARVAMVVMSITIGLNLPMAVFTAVLVGHRRRDLTNAVEVTTKVASALVIYTALTQGGGLIELSAIQACTMLATWVLTIVLVKQVGGEFSLLPTWFKPGSIKELTGYGGKQFVINLATIVIERSDLIVVGIVLGLRWVTFYAIAASLVQYARTACCSFSQSYTPYLTHLHSKGNHLELQRLFLNGARWVSLFSACLVACMMAFGDRFISLWLDDSYLKVPFTMRSDIVMIVLLFADLPRMLQDVPRQLLFASQKQAYLMIVMIGEAIANITLSLILVRHLGLVGVALGTLIPRCLTHLVIVPMYLIREFDFRSIQYFSSTLGKPLLVGLSLYGISRTLVVLVGVHTWVSFFALSFCCIIVGVLINLMLGLNASERESSLDTLKNWIFQQS